MAITLADFTKIWASTSPLTPYSFSDSNYQEGWNFVGTTPPARQMWDSIQKQNDEKMEYIVNNFLPLSGGTLTGVVNGVTPAVGDNTTKLATTEYVRNEISPIGMTYFGEWIANSSSVTNVELTKKIENVPTGKYLVIVKTPLINISTVLVNIASDAGVNAIGGSSIPILDMAGQTTGSFAIEVTNSTNAIVLVSGSSTSVTFSYTNRGGLTLVRISG